MADVSKIKLPSGTTYNIKDITSGYITSKDIINTVEGSIVSFSNGADDYPLKSLKVTLEPIQEGSGDPSPSNVRPISGRDEVNVAVTGKNLLDASILKDQVAWNSGEIKLAPNTQYTVSSNCDGNIVYLYVMGVGQTPNPQTTVYQGHSISVTSDANGILRYQQRVPSLSAGSVSDYWYQLEVGSTATAYEPYQGTTYTTDLGRTVYGGTLDVVSGKLTVTHGIVDLGTLNWNSGAISGRNVFYTALSDAKTVSNSNKFNGIAERYAVIRYNGIASDDFLIALRNNGTLYVSGTVSPSGNLVYELATPIEYQLTPQQVYLYSGASNVWGSGDVTIEYIVDGKVAEDIKFIGGLNLPSQLVGTTVNTTPTQVQTALANNQNVEITYTDSTYGTFKFYDFIIAPSAYPVVCASAIMKYDNIWMVAELIGQTNDNSWHAYYTTVAETSNIPTKTSQLTNDSGFITTDTNTHRPIQVNGTEILGNNTTALNLKAGSNISLSNSSGTVTIAATDTIYESKTAASGGTEVSLVTTGEKYTWNNKSDLTIGTTSNTAAAGNHTHGNITNSGDITTTATITSGDRLVINDESASKVANSTITFGTSTTQYLANNGTWQSIPTVSAETDPVFSASAAAGITSTNISNWNAKATVQIVRWS